MKKYIVEEENNFNGGEEFETLEEAKEYFNTMLHDLSNYNYSINKDKMFTLFSVEITEDEEDNTEYDNWKELASCSVADYRDFSLEEKEKLLDLE